MKKPNSLEVGPATEEKIQAVVDRIVEVAKPQQIILFGSHARGKAKDHSDLDLLIVKDGDYHKGKLIEEIYMNLVGVKQAVDVVIVTPKEIEQYRGSPSLVIKPALDEGKIIYER